MTRKVNNAKDEKIHIRISQVFKNKFYVFFIFYLPTIICKENYSKCAKILDLSWKDNYIGLADIQKLDPSITL